MKQAFSIVGMTCNGCKKSVEKSILTVQNVKNITVALDKGEAIVESEKPISILDLQTVLPDKFKILKKIEKQTAVHSEKEKSEIQQLFPLFLIFGYILVTSILLNLNSWNTSAFMLDFMGLFYLVFSFFKILDVKGFANSFKMYDPIAKKISFYGFIYPFIELTLGVLFLYDYSIFWALLLTIILLGITTIGVTKSLLGKQTIQCACLGSVLNLPMTKATFIENTIMILMAIVMLLKYF